jgi:membrane-bound ClpP family serine protease
MHTAVRMHLTTQDDKGRETGDQMSVRSDILAVLADPTAAYIVLLGGCVLLVVEFLRPGRGWAGIPGAVLATTALYSFSQQPVTWCGLCLLALSICLVLSTLRGRSHVAPLLSGGMVVAGSALLVDGAERIHIVAASTGGVFAFILHWLLRTAYVARMAKRANG